MLVKELIFSETAGLEPKTSEKKELFFRNVYFKEQLLDWLFPILEVAVVRVWLIFLKCCHESLSFNKNLKLGE